MKVNVLKFVEKVLENGERKTVKLCQSQHGGRGEFLLFFKEGLERVESRISFVKFLASRHQSNTFLILKTQKQDFLGKKSLKMQAK